MTTTTTAIQMKFGETDLAKYPFLQQAGQQLQGIDITALGNDTRLIEIASERLTLAAKGVYSVQLEHEALHEIKIFALELLLCRYIGINSLVRKFSLAEARRVEEFLQRDLKEEKESTTAMVLYILQNEFGLQVVIEPVSITEEDALKHARRIKKSNRKKAVRHMLTKNAYGIKVPQYLRIAPGFHSEHWHLINRVVNRGYVWLDSDGIVRLARNMLQQKIIDRATKMKVPALVDFSKHFQLNIRYMQGELTPLLVHKIYFSGTYPPCVAHCIDVLNKGENLGHYARLFLASYMLAIGRDVEDIVAMYRNAPDFNESKSRYHVQSLTKEKAGHEYSVMGCAKVLSNGFCFRNQQCGSIHHPLAFGREKKQID